MPTLEQAERQLIRQALGTCGGNRQTAATMLGMYSFSSPFQEKVQTG